MDPFLQAAIKEAKTGLSEGGIPIGSVLVHDGKIIGRGHNQRVQRGSVIHHGEMNCLENAGRQSAEVYRLCTIYTTLSPCPMCTGAILLYGIPRVVIGENVTFKGAEVSLRAAGVEMEVRQDAECIRMMREFIEKNPELWNEDIGR
ncbi:MAG: nucleoside deaminase [Verrucomicrobiota bacterium]|nr:nucleoside deaminase [Verrucomicrobiota bacterium]